MNSAFTRSARADGRALAMCHARSDVFHFGSRARPSFRETRDQFVRKRATKRAPKSAPFCISLKPLSRRILPKPLALGELERPACLGATVLLALDDAGVAGQETALLQDAAQIRLEVRERLGDAVTHRAGLARKAPAGDRADHVILPGALGGDQRLLDHHPQHR